MRQIITILLWFIALNAPAGEALDTAPATTQIGGIELPLASALARHEHPRLLFTKAEVPGIRARIAKPALAGIYARLKKTVDEQLAGGMARVQSQGAARMLVPLGLLYHLTGELKYGQACRELTLKASFGVYATEGVYGYDLVYDLLSPEERRQCEEKMLAYIQRPYPDGNVFIQCVALWGSGNQDDLVARKLAQMHAWCLKRKEYLNAWAADRGGDGNSHGYIGQHEYVGTMGAFQAWRAATGEDWFEGFNWAKTMGPYYVYHLLPNRRLTVNIGINSWGARHAPIETGAEDFVALAQANLLVGGIGFRKRALQRARVALQVVVAHCERGLRIALVSEAPHAQRRGVREVERAGGKPGEPVLPALDEARAHRGRGAEQVEQQPRVAPEVAHQREIAGVGAA